VFKRTTHRCTAQVGQQLRMGLLSLWRAHAQDGRGMPGCQGLRMRADRLPAPALAGHAEAVAEQGLRRHRTEGDHDRGPDPVELGGQPRTAGGLLGGRGAAVDPSLAARHELEMLDGVGEPGRARVQAGLGQQFAQQPPGRAHERFAAQVFFRPGLLADQHDPGARLAAAEYGLGSRPP
jgi:hypothetical protein